MFTSISQSFDMPEDETQNEALNIFSLFEYIPDLNDEVEDLGVLYALSSPDIQTSADSDTLSQGNPTPPSTVDEALTNAEEFDELANNISVISLRTKADSLPDAVLTSDTPKHSNSTQSDLPQQFHIHSFRIEPRTREPRQSNCGGNNQSGRNGKLRCEECRRRKRKCNFSATNLPCQFCKSRGLPCNKKWGEKRQMREEIVAWPTAIDNVIRPEDVTLLQYAYSDWFQFNGGTMLAGLIRKFAVTFGQSICSLSLRHATLAWAAAFIQLHLPFTERIQYHLDTANRTLQSKITSRTVDEADLYAASILTYLSGICMDQKYFEIHLNWVGLIMQELSVRFAKRGISSDLWIFLPLVRDLILEGSRRIAHPNNLIITFFYLSSRAPVIGPASFQGRALYINELFGYDPTQQRVFSQAVWHHFTILRKSFRDTVEHQIENKQGTSIQVQTLVSEAKADLHSVEMQDVVERLSFRQTLSEYKHQIDLKYESSKIELLLYRFCLHLITLLEADNVVHGASSREAISSALSILQLIDYRWLDPNNYGLLWLPEMPLCLSRFLLIRILWIVDLTLVASETYSEASRIIADQLEKAGEGHFVRGLEEYQKNPNCIQILVLLDTHSLRPFPNSYIQW